MPLEDHPEQEDHRTHHQEPLPMRPNTGIPSQCIIMECIIYAYKTYNSNNVHKIMLEICRISRMIVKIMGIIVVLKMCLE